MRRGRPGWKDGQMEQAYGRCDAIRMQDASGEISGADSYMHAKSNRHGDSLVCVRSCEDWPGCTTAAPRLFVPLKPLVQDEKQKTASLANSIYSSWEMLKHFITKVKVIIW